MTTRYTAHTTATRVAPYTFRFPHEGRTWQAQRKAEHESGASYSPNTPFDDLRAGLVRLCRETIESHITNARESYGDAGCSVDDARRVRESLVSRLVDVLQERGEAVQVMSVRPREASPFETTIHVA